MKYLKIAFFLILFTVLSCVAKPGSYTNNDYNFSLMIPSGWEVTKEGPDPLVVRLNNSENDNINIQAQRYPPEAPDFESAPVNLQKEVYNGLLGDEIATMKNSGVEVISARVADFDNKPRIEISSIYREFKIRQIGFIKNKTYFIITLRVKTENFDKYLKDYEELVSSFKKLN